MHSFIFAFMRSESYRWNSLGFVYLVFVRLVGCLAFLPPCVCRESVSVQRGGGST